MSLVIHVVVLLFGNFSTMQDDLSHPDVPKDVSWMVRCGGVLKPNHCFCWPILFLHIVCCLIFFSGGIICIWLVPSCDCDIFGHSSAQGWLWQQNGYLFVILGAKGFQMWCIYFCFKRKHLKIVFPRFCSFLCERKLGCFCVPLALNGLSASWELQWTSCLQSSYALRLGHVGRRRRVHRLVKESKHQNRRFIFRK